MGKCGAARPHHPDRIVSVAVSDYDLHHVIGVDVGEREQLKPPDPKVVHTAITPLP